MKAATAADSELRLKWLISIHAAREGGDKTEKHDYREMRISIHAAREGGDAAVHTDNQYPTYFNPRRP